MDDTVKKQLADAAKLLDDMQERGELPPAPPLPGEQPAGTQEFVAGEPQVPPTPSAAGESIKDQPQPMFAHDETSKRQQEEVQQEERVWREKMLAAQPQASGQDVQLTIKEELTLIRQTVVEVSALLQEVFSQRGG